MGKRKAKTYRSLSGRYGGHAAGETFSAEMSAEHEQYLIGAGHIEIVKPGSDSGDSDGAADSSNDKEN